VFIDFGSERESPNFDDKKRHLKEQATSMESLVTGKQKTKAMVRKGAPSVLVFNFAAGEQVS
jgi:hypothetical protein